jgi:hypothetical protein
VWTGVDGCGRVWTDVDGCGRMWTDVDGCGRMGWAAHLCGATVVLLHFSLAPIERSGHKPTVVAPASGDCKNKPQGVIGTERKPWGKLAAAQLVTEELAAATALMAVDTVVAHDAAAPRLSFTHLARAVETSEHGDATPAWQRRSSMATPHQHGDAAPAWRRRSEHRDAALKRKAGVRWRVAGENGRHTVFAFSTVAYRKLQVVWLASSGKLYPLLDTQQRAWWDAW